MQMPPGSAIPSRRAATLTPSPRMSSPSIRMSPRLIPIRDSIRRSCGTPFVLTTPGGDFALHIGQDVSIGYLSHTDSVVRLYLQETLTFLLLTTEAVVALSPAAGK